MGWLRAPAENVIVLDGTSGLRRPATVNRYLAGVFGFYDPCTGREWEWRPSWWRGGGLPRGSYKPFLHHVTKGRPIPTRPVKLHVTRQAPRTLEAEQIVAVLAACDHLRDQFLMSLLAETGMRVGQALGLRHADFVSRKHEVHIVPRADNANRARAKVRLTSVVPVSTPLVRLYSEYMHVEYRDLDSDYVFVNLFAGRIGRPMGYPTVEQLIGRIAARTGIAFNTHMLRHSHATEMIRRGVPIEVVARLLTHRSSTTTSQTYIHLDAQDVRDALLRAGVWERSEVATGIGGGQVSPASASSRAATLNLTVVAARDTTLEGEWAGDHWDAARLGIPVRRGRGRARFDTITQGWPRGGQALVPVPSGHRMHVRDHLPRGRWPCTRLSRFLAEGDCEVVDEDRPHPPGPRGLHGLAAHPGLLTFHPGPVAVNDPGVLRRLPPPRLATPTRCGRHHLCRGTPFPPRTDRPVHPRVRHGPTRVRPGASPDPPPHHPPPGGAHDRNRPARRSACNLVFNPLLDDSSGWPCL